MLAPGRLTEMPGAAHAGYEHEGGASCPPGVTAVSATWSGATPDGGYGVATSPGARGLLPPPSPGLPDRPCVTASAGSNGGIIVMTVPIDQQRRDRLAGARLPSITGAEAARTDKSFVCTDVMQVLMHMHLNSSAGTVN